MKRTTSRQTRTTGGDEGGPTLKRFVKRRGPSSEVARSGSQGGKGIGSGGLEVREVREVREAERSRGSSARSGSQGGKGIGSGGLEVREVREAERSRDPSARPGSRGGKGIGSGGLEVREVREVREAERLREVLDQHVRETIGLSNATVSLSGPAKETATPQPQVPGPQTANHANRGIQSLLCHAHQGHSVLIVVNLVSGRLQREKVGPLAHAFVYLATLPRLGG